jgi:hypothetical protein
MDHHQAILKAAGISYKDEQGRQADFHALRHTFNTRMARAGVPDALRQAAMRHLTPALTVGVYTDRTGLGTAEAIGSMPSLVGLPSPVASPKFGARGPAVSSGGKGAAKMNAAVTLANIGKSHVGVSPVTMGQSEEVGCLARTRT